ARSSAAGLVEEPGQTALDIARAPLADGIVGDPELLGHLPAGKTIGAAQDDASTLSQPVAGLGAPGPSEDFRSVSLGDDERSFMGTAALHGVNLIVRPAGDLTIIPLTSVTGH